MHTQTQHFTSSQPQLCCLRSAAKVSNATEQMPLPRALPRLLPTSGPAPLSTTASYSIVPRPLMRAVLVQKSHVVFSTGLWRIPPPSSVSPPHVCTAHSLRLLQSLGRHEITFCAKNLLPPLLSLIELEGFTNPHPCRSLST